MGQLTAPMWQFLQFEFESQTRTSPNEVFLLSASESRSFYVAAAFASCCTQRSLSQASILDRFDRAIRSPTSETPYGLVQNLFRVGRHLLRADHHRELRGRALLAWDTVTIAV